MGLEGIAGQHFATIRRGDNPNFTAGALNPPAIATRPSLRRFPE